MSDSRQLALIDLPDPPSTASIEADTLLPESLRALNDAGVSIETIRMLVEAFPGCRVSIPRTGTTDCQLVAALGEERANEIASAASGAYLYVPACTMWLRAERNRLILEAYAARMPMAEICKTFKTSEPTVRRILAG